MTCCLTCPLDHLRLLVDDLVVSTSYPVEPVNEDNSLAVVVRVTLVHCIFLVLVLDVIYDLPVPALIFSPGEAVIHSELSLLLVTVTVGPRNHVVTGS